jgi:hypothetical protein
MVLAQIVPTYIVASTRGLVSPSPKKWRCYQRWKTVPGRGKTGAAAVSRIRKKSFLKSFDKLLFSTHAAGLLHLASWGQCYVFKKIFSQKWRKFWWPKTPKLLSYVTLTPVIANATKSTATYVHTEVMLNL